MTTIVRSRGGARPRCPYCHATLDAGEATWRCTKCATEHHAACARENGGCTILGCGIRLGGARRTRSERDALVARITLMLAAGLLALVLLMKFREPALAPPGPVLRGTYRFDAGASPTIDAHALEGLDGGSVALWLRRDGGGAARVLTKAVPSTWEDLVLDLTPDGRPHMRIGYRRGQTLTSDIPIEPGAFHHVVFEWGDGGMRIFVDGELAAENEQICSVGDRGDVVAIGRDPSSNGRRYPITVRELSLYEGALTDQQIRALARSRPSTR